MSERSENFEDLLRDHYRRAAENIRPDTELIDRYRRAGRPARALPVRASVLLAAAAVALTALVTWGLLRPGHRDVPAPPLPAGPPTSSTTVTPSPTPSGPHGSAPVRRPPAATPSPRPPRPPQFTSPSARTRVPTGRPSRPATPGRAP